MEQYIPKSTLITEIKQRLHKYEKEYEKLTHYEIWITAKEIEPKIKELKNLLSFIDTLETKEINLEKEIDLDTEIMKYQKEIYDRDTTVRDVAKHFFNLGFNVQKGE